ncbi:MAG TPA: ATPase, T2SS/T4P/T4SS family [Actinomycetota bacterium]|nr:ATPase, T2SS/T4P/T4SS family [Actinomycetota bacterium]
MSRREDPSGPLHEHAELVREVRARLAAGGSGVSQGSVEKALREVLSARGAAWEQPVLTAQAVAICDELSGFGPLGPLMRDPEVTEVMINPGRDVYVEREGQLRPAGVSLRSEQDVHHLIERVVSPLGLRIDASSPWVDARLEDGSRFHAVVPPVAIGGPVVTIRKFSKTLWKLRDLVRMGCVDDAQARLLAAAVRERRNILVCGGGGTGKTTLLGVLARLVPRPERIVTIEDAAELQLGPRHAVALQTKPANIEGRGEITLRDLVRCAMRMRADRIVVGEVRGPEALDMLQALNSGHAGSMATVHANAPAEALTRLETMALMAAPGLSVAAARRQVGSAVHVIVHLVREPSGRRRVADMAEVRAGAQGPVLRRRRVSAATPSFARVAASAAASPAPAALAARASAAPPNGSCA